MTMKFLKGLHKDELFRYGSVMFVASIISNALNYIYQIYMGRALGPEEYGVFGALFAIFYMLAIVSNTLGTSTTSFVANLAAENRKIGSFLRGAFKRMILTGLIFSFAFFLTRNNIASFLKMPNAEPVVVLAFILFLAWIMPITGGTLRGLKRFYALGSITVSSTFFKLISAIALVALGYGVTGALLGAAIGSLVAIFISLYLIAPYLKQSSHDSNFNFSAFYSYSAPVLLAMFCFSVPSNLDVILAKYFFSAHVAGLYTSASVLGKIVFFFPSAIYAVMFPMIAERHTRGEATGGVLKKSLVYSFLLSGFVVATYILFPRLVVIFFGSRYLEALPLIAPYGLAMLFFSLSTILLNYHLAIKNMRYVVIFAGFTILEVFLLLIFHTSPLEMIYVLLSVNFALLIAGLIYTLR